MKMETVLPAPFAGRVKELLVVGGQPGGDRRGAAYGWSHRRRREAAAQAAPRPPTSTCRRRRTRRRRRAGRPRAAPTCRRCSSATTSTRAREPHARRLPRGARRARRERRVAGRDEMDLLGVFADFAELSRNRPVGEEAHIENRVHSPREHFHTYLQTLDPERGALPADFVGRLERCSRHYGVDRPRPHPRARGGRVPGVPRPAALRSRGDDGHLDPAALAGRAGAGRRRRTARPASCSTGSSRPPSCASPSSATWPAASGSAGSTSRSSTPTGRRCSARSATSWSRSTRCPTARNAPRVSTRWPRSPSGSSASSASGSDGACPRASRCSRCSSSATTASTRCTDLRELTVDGRAVATADYRLDERDSHLVSTIGTLDELTADSRAVAARSPRWSPTARRSRGGRRPLPALARPPDDPEEASASSPSGWPDAVRGPGAPGRRRRRARRRPRGRLLHVPARSPTAPWTRTARSATCTRWSGAGSTSGGCATSS